MPNAYVANGASDNITVIDTGTTTVTATISLPAGADPDSVAVTPAGSKAYVSNSGSGASIYVIDTSTNTVIDTITLTGISSPNAIAVTPDGTKLYISNAGNGTVQIVNTSTKTVLATLAFGTVSGPAEVDGVAVSPDNSTAYIAVAGLQYIAVVNNSTNAITTTIPVGAGVYGIAFTPDGRKVYASFENTNKIVVIDTGTTTISATISLPGTVTDSAGVAVTPDGSKAYVANFGNGQVTVINISTNTIAATVAVGSGPYGVSATLDSTKVYVTNDNSGTVSVIDAASNTVSATVTVGSHPSSVGQFIQPPINSNTEEFMNKFRNGTMDIWQRGAGPFTVTTSGAYTADGWIVVPTGASCTAQQTTSNGRTGRLTTYSLLMTGATSVTDILVKQRIESFWAVQLEGQQVTVQAQVYNNTGASITPTLTVKHANAADNWSASTTDVNAVSLQSCANGAWTQVAYTFAASSSSGNGLEITFDFGNNFSTTGKSVQITELDIRPTPGAVTGLNSSPPVPELRPVAVEYAISQYYLPAVNTGGNGISGIAQGQATTSTTGFINFLSPTSTRVPVNGVSVSSVSDFAVSNSAGSSITCTSISFASANRNAYSINIGVATGLSAGNATQLQTLNSSARLVFTGAEL